MTTDVEAAHTAGGEVDEVSPLHLGSEVGDERPETGDGSPFGEDRQVPDVVRAACHFAAARQRPTAVFVLAEGDPAEGTPDVPITMSSVTQLGSALGEVSGFDKLDLVIQSSGGDIHAAYRLMSFLRRRMTEGGELAACVPRKAQSSATLLCLGGDRIVLDELAALGPLDAQIRIGVTDVGTPDYASALHLLKGLARLREFSLETLNHAAVMLYDKRVRRSDDIVKYGIEFSRGISAPLFERIESHRIGYWDQMLRTGEAYGKRLLERGKLIRDSRDLEREEHIRRVIHRLVNEYPSHEYVIDCEELVNKLDLNAELFEGEARPAARELATCNSETLIMVVYPPGVDPPKGMREEARKTSRLEWNTLSNTRGVGTLAWEAFVMRVGLYHRPLKAARNPWRESTTPADGAPSEQYFTGVGPGW